MLDLSHKMNKTIDHIHRVPPIGTEMPGAVGRDARARAIPPGRRHYRTEVTCQAR
jgi:hypothetical protein